MQSKIKESHCRQSIGKFVVLLDCFKQYKKSHPIFTLDNVKLYTVFYSAASN